MEHRLDDLVILANRTAGPFAEKVVEKINRNKEARALKEVHLGKCEITDFASGEVFATIKENVRKKSVYVIAQFGNAGRDIYRDREEVFKIYDALARAGATEIIGVEPYMLHMRQDRKASGREPISAAQEFKLHQGASLGKLNRIVTVQLHQEAEQGFLDGPLDNLDPMPLFVLYFKCHPELQDKKYTVVAPDAGSIKRARNLATYLGVGHAVIDKDRRPGAPPKAKQLLGDVRGSSCIFIDDMIDTASSLFSAVELARKEGANHRAYAACAHGLFSKHPEREHYTEYHLDNENIEVVTTDSLFRTQEYRDTAKGWLKTMSLSKYMAELVLCDHWGMSVTETMNEYLRRAIAGESKIDNYMLPTNEG